MTPSWHPGPTGWCSFVTGGSWTTRRPRRVRRCPGPGSRPMSTADSVAGGCPALAVSPPGRRCSAGGAHVPARVATTGPHHLAARYCSRRGRWPGDRAHNLTAVSAGSQFGTANHFIQLDATGDGELTISPSEHTGGGSEAEVPTSPPLGTGSGRSTSSDNASSLSRDGSNPSSTGSRTQRRIRRADDRSLGGELSGRRRRGGGHGWHGRRVRPRDRRHGLPRRHAADRGRHRGEPQ